MAEELVSSCQSTFSKRTQQVAAALLQSANSDPLSSLVPLVRQAWALQQKDAVYKTTELAASRTRACCTTLQSALSSITDITDAMRGRVESEACSAMSSLPCLAAALCLSKLSSPVCSWQLPCAPSAPVALQPNHAAASNCSSRMCTICSACQRISTAMIEAVGLHLGVLASRAAAALHWGIYRSSPVSYTHLTLPTILLV